jgi:hypothetical protein
VKVSKHKTRQARAQEHVASIEKALKPQKEEGKGPKPNLLSKNKAYKLVQLPKISRNKPMNKLLCKLNTTCSWFNNNKALG